MVQWRVLDLPVQLGVPGVGGEWEAAAGWGVLQGRGGLAGGAGVIWHVA